MICPYCNYEHGWNYNEDKNIIGKKRVFYKLPIEMTKKDPWEEI